MATKAQTIVLGDLNLKACLDLARAQLRIPVTTTRSNPGHQKDSFRSVYYGRSSVSCSFCSPTKVEWIVSECLIASGAFMIKWICRRNLPQRDIERYRYREGRIRTCKAKRWHTAWILWIKGGTRSPPRTMSMRNPTLNSPLNWQ